MFNSIFETAVTDTTITATTLLLALIVSFSLGVFMSIVYMNTNKNKGYSQDFAITLVILPAVVTVIILLVGTNVARAFSLAGAFSIIRFRSALENPKDITYVLFSMAIGLACGMGYLAYATITAIMICIVLTVIELSNFGYPKTTNKLLKITIPENLDYENTFESILKKYTNSFNLRKVRTTDLGSLFELVYCVNTKNDLSEKSFIDELRCRNGNLNITLVLDSGVEA